MRVASGVLAVVALALVALGVVWGGWAALALIDLALLLGLTAAALCGCRLYRLASAVTTKVRALSSW